MNHGHLAIENKSDLPFFSLFEGNRCPVPTIPYKTSVHNLPFQKTVLYGYPFTISRRLK